jgi:arginyl-tRNA synthetase
MRKKIKEITILALKGLTEKKYFPDEELGKELKIEIPRQDCQGDYASNLPLLLAKKNSKQPLEIGEIIKKEIEKADKDNLLEKIEIAPPGFINFFLSKDIVQKQVEEILAQGKSFGAVDLGKKKKVQVEFISANPTGPLTVANARGGPIGDVLANVLNKAGFKAEKAYYINDYGNQIMALGHSILQDDKAEYKGEYIKELAEKIKEKDPYKAGKKAAEMIVAMIKKTTDSMGIEYDEWISESDFHNKGRVDELIDSLGSLVYKKEGALWFKSSEFGDTRDRVLVKSDNWKTYLAGDLALHDYKLKNFDKLINIWGADHYGDIPGLMALVEALGHKGKLEIILYQFITILEGGEKKRMSKRKGVFVTMDELLEEVGRDVVRFFFLEKSADTHLNFDLSLAKEQSEKNPVYYIQYAYARICSILRNTKISPRPEEIDFQLLNSPAELRLIKQLIRLPEVIRDTAQDYQVQRLPKYIFETSACFHQFYKNCRVLTDNKELTKARLGLIYSTKIVLKNVLDIMGISAPEKM